MHTETLLNPFFMADYTTYDDGQDHSVFTSISDPIPILQAENEISDMLSIPREPSTPRQKTHKKQEIDEIEDLVLEDFSFSDNHYSEEGSDGAEDIVSRCSSVDSMASFSIRR